jgi:hypothetical protein
MKIHFLLRQLILDLKGVKPLNGMTKEEYAILSKQLLENAGSNLEPKNISNKV